MSTTEPKKILIADDEQPMAQALSIKLTHEGFSVKTARNGEEVLDILSKESFDLLLLDLVMPRKDGFAVLEELQSKGSKLPIIVTSNLGQAEDIKRVQSYGVNDYLIKSDNSISEMVSHIKEVMNRS